ncbi:MAG: adenylate/guanylate cyclase domain-containing protein [Nitrosomonadales bacterium]|nr:MAG: adenylate/guanylate cyclase domain-containing protein [Nitrosomonadales bacterium]
MTTENNGNQPPEPEESDDIEQFLEQQAKLEAALKKKFTKFITIMFTDLKGSTSIAETEGDMVSRMLIKEHNDIVMPAIQQNNGVFIKSIGDGTLSTFENALDAVRAAVRIQRGMDELNMAQKFKIPVLMRIGLHSGMCIVEKNDIFGDAVNTASRFESSATPGDIFMSENTYNALSDKSEIYCRFVKQVTLKGKKEPYNAYKAFWNPQEIERDRIEGAAPAAPAPKPTSKLKLILIVLIPLLLVLALTMRDKVGDQVGMGNESRTINYSIPIPDEK